MKRLATTALIGLLALSGPALARQDDMDVNRLNSSLNQLASDPRLGTYAQAEQARAEAARAKKLAAAQSRVARAARREAEAAAEAARAMRSQMQGDTSSTPPAEKPAPKKSSSKGSKGH